MPYLHPRTRTGQGGSSLNLTSFTAFAPEELSSRVFESAQFQTPRPVKVSLNGFFPTISATTFFTPDSVITWSVDVRLVDFLVPVPPNSSIGRTVSRFFMGGELRTDANGVTRYTDLTRAGPPVAVDVTATGFSIEDFFLDLDLGVASDDPFSSGGFAGFLAKRADVQTWQRRFRFGRVFRGYR